MAPEPSYVDPGIDAGYVAPEPSYSAPEPSYAAPEPSYSAPEPNYSAPEPNYVDAGNGASNPGMDPGNFAPEPSSRIPAWVPATAIPGMAMLARWRRMPGSIPEATSILAAWRRIPAVAVVVAVGEKDTTTTVES